MFVRFLVAAAVVVLAAGVAALVRRRREADPPTQPGRALPSQLDRRDFDGAGWLLVVFTSVTCDACADVTRKAEAARSDALTVQVVSYQEQPGLHRRYAIDAVPAVLIADPEGVVRKTFLGPVTATDLWAAIADARS